MAPEVENEQEVTDRRSVVSVVASDKILTKALIAEVTETVDRRIQNREAKRQKIWNIVIIILGLIGITGVAALVNISVDSVVETELEKQQELIFQTLKNDIRQSLLDETAEFRRAIEEQATYQQFAYMALSLDLKTEFSGTERDAVISLLESLATSEKMRARSEFPALLEKVIDSFASAGLHVQLNKLVSLFGPEVTGTAGIVHTMIQHYGQRVVGSSFPPERWPELTVNRFDKFEIACQAHKIPEISMPYRLLIEFRRADNQPTSLTRKLLGDAAFFPTPEERASFHLLLIRHTDTDFWQKRATALGERIEQVCSAFRDAHRQEITKLLDDEDLKRSLYKLALSRFASGDEGQMKLASAIFNEVGYPDSPDAGSPNKGMENDE